MKKPQAYLAAGHAASLQLAKHLEAQLFKTSRNMIRASFKLPSASKLGEVSLRQGHRNVRSGEFQNKITFAFSYQ